MDVTKLTGEEVRKILDFVLEHTYHPRDYEDIRTELLSYQEYFPDRDEYLLRMTVTKLYKDKLLDFIIADTGKFIYEHEPKPNITIRRNFNGHIFLANGGYIGEEQSRIEKERVTEAWDQRTERNERRLVQWTRILAVRTHSLRNWTRVVGIATIALVLATLLLAFLEIFGNHETIVKTFLLP